jgi:hypothetical protein
MSESSLSEGVDKALGRRRSGTGVFVLAVIAAVLAIAYIAHAGEPARLAAAIKVKEAKLLDTKKFIAENYDSIIGTDNVAEQTAGPGDIPLLTIVKESVEAIGLTNNLSGVSPEENRKLGEVTAKVTLRRIRLADLVNFLVYVRSKYSGIVDREGRMRLVPRQEGDNWDAFISLTAKRR